MISSPSAEVPISQPSRRSTSPMIAMSVICGTFCSVVRPGARRAAAISFRAEFFAPPTCTSPSRRAPPTTRIRSAPAVNVTGAIVGSAHETLPTLYDMAVHLTRIYTKTGDAGTTALGDGSRVAKTDPHIEAYADVDEANAALGVALAVGSLSDEVRTVVMMVQNDLFDVGADLCCPLVAESERPQLRATDEQIARLE